MRRCKKAQIKVEGEENHRTAISSRSKRYYYNEKPLSGSNE